MKDTSSIPQDFNPNYEERRKRFVPAKHQDAEPPKPASNRGGEPNGSKGNAHPARNAESKDMQDKSPELSPEQ